MDLEARTVTGASGVSVIIPSTSDLAAFLQNDKVTTLASLDNINRHTEAYESVNQLPGSHRAGNIVR